MGRKKNDDTIEVHTGVYLKRSAVDAPWQCYFRLDGRQVRKSTKTTELVVAKQLALQWFNEASRPTLEVPSRKRISFESLVESYLAHIQGLSKFDYHRDTLNRHILPYFRQFKDIGRLTNADVQDYVNHRRLKGSVLPQTLNRENTVLRQLMTYAEKRGVLGQPIVIDHLNERLTRRRRPHFTIEEYVRLCHVAQARIEERDVTGKPLNSLVRQQRQLLFDYIKFLTNSGLRVDEARELRWRNIDLEGRKVLVESSGKTNRTRTAFVRATGILALRRIYDRRQNFILENGLGELNPNDRVFCLDDGTPVDSFKKGFNALLQAAGFDYSDGRQKHALYSLRHSYATFRLTTKRAKRTSAKPLALQMGTSVRMIEKFYGHDEILDYEEELAGCPETKP
jgi:integrase